MNWNNFEEQVKEIAVKFIKENDIRKGQDLFSKMWNEKECVGELFLNVLCEVFGTESLDKILEENGEESEEDDDE
jgi:hypothetical protein